MPRKSSVTEEQSKIIEKRYRNGIGSPTIAKELGLKTNVVAYWIKTRIGIRSCREAAKKFQFDENFFEKIDTEEKAYWLGFIYADGYIASHEYSKFLGITLSIKDKKHLEKINASLKSNVPIRIYNASKSNYSTNPYCRVIYTSNKLYNDLIKHGVLEHKTNVLKPPQIDEGLKHHFIRGYFDGDGCLAKTVSHKTGKIEYAFKVLSTEYFLDYIKDFIEANNIAKINQYYKRRTGQTVSSLEIGGNRQVSNLMSLLYKNATIYLDRKYNRYIEMQQARNSRVTS